MDPKGEEYIMRRYKGLWIPVGKVKVVVSRGAPKR
jgi:hypothetical protein